MERARQLVFNWVQRAIVLGYLQEIQIPAAHLPDLVPAEQAVAAGPDWGLLPDHAAKRSGEIASSQVVMLP
jgi:hypothetical protein